MSKISIILPVYNYKDPILKVLKKINDQTLKPNEIIIVDSSNNIKIQEMVRSFNSSIFILYHWVPKAYPGQSRNIGVKLTKNEYVAFVDSKTLPKKNWLSEYIKILKDDNLEYKIGITEFKSISTFQKLVNSATFGNINYSTIPGSIFKKDFFLKSGGFLNYLRSAEDQHFFSKIKFIQKKDYDNSYLIYNDLPSNFISFISKYFLYSYHTSFINIQGITKNLYFLIFTFLTISMFLSLKNMYPIYFLEYYHLYSIFFFIAIPFIIVNFVLVLIFERMKKEILYQLLKILILIIVFYSAYKWNMYVADWLETSKLYIPHVTKSLILCTIFISIFYRGLILPLKRKVEIDFIFPFNWIRIGFLGLTIDVVKSPAYVFGAINYPFIQLYDYLKKIYYK